jgi:hypothetical protein
MTLYFRWLHALRWSGHIHVNRAMTLVLGVIGVSLLFGALRVVDAALSGTEVARRAAAVAPAASGSPEMLMVTEPASAGRPVDTCLDVPDATVEAISL